METVSWIVACFGFVAMIGVFARMEKGFGPNNLRAMGIVLVATMSSVLACSNDNCLSAAMGILGAIAGYLFGIQAVQPKPSQPTEAVKDPEKKSNG